MNKIKMTAGIAWAIGCLLMMTILYFALGSFSVGFARLPFMKLNPNCTGGDTAMVAVTENCTLMIRKPVFDGFLGDRKIGFVQVEWHGNISEVICDTIDYNLDKSPDFVIGIKRPENSVRLDALNPLVRTVSLSTPTSYGWAARIGISKK